MCGNRSYMCLLEGEGNTGRIVIDRVRGVTEGMVREKHVGDF